MINILLILIFMCLVSSCEFLNSSSSSGSSSSIITSDITSYPASFKFENYKILSDIYSGVMPSSGDVNVLVIPVDFPDYPSKYVSKTLNQLNDAFFGNDNETEWESVSSYYYKSSYGKLNINGTITQWYRAPKFSTYYEDNGYESLFELFNYIMDDVSKSEWFDPSDYDFDNDGFYDGIYFIYSVPIMNNYNSIWWAFTGEFKSSKYYGGKKIGKFVFASIEFLSYQFGTNVDPTAFIHETGHLLGLDDYYDYSNIMGPNGGIGQTDMMENNIGDHSSLSKLLLGWTYPTVVTDSISITIDSFYRTGDVILVTNGFHDSVFDEYILIDVYDPEAINISQYETYGDVYKPTLTKKGVRFYHIDAKLGNGSIYGAYYYYTLFAKNNSTTATKLIKLIEKGNTNYIETNLIANDNMMYYHNDTFNTNYKYRLYNLETFNFSFLVTQNEDTSFTIEITRH